MDAQDAQPPPPSDSAAQEILSRSFLNVFVKNGTISEEDLDVMEQLAMRDGVVDRKERAVLTRILDQLDDDELDGDLRKRIESFRERHGIG